jgi:membrane fusion protein, multidrug efflux system
MTRSMMNRVRTMSASPAAHAAVVGLATLAVAIIVTACSSGSAETTTPGGGGGGGRGGGGRGRNAGVQPVVVTKVIQKDVPVDIAAVGNVEAYTSISVRSQVTGQIQQAFFHEGDLVKKGALLFKIDPRPLEAALQQSVANETRDKALLEQAEAQLTRDAATAEYQQLTSERQAGLVKSGIVSKDVGDQSRAQADATLATVNADKAAVASAKAQLTVQESITENAKVQLSYTEIRSPIDGRTGNNTVKVGNLAGVNQELVTVAQLEPVYVTFTVPAVHLPTIKQHMGANKLTVVATPQDEDKQQAEGQLTFLDNTVDATTDTIKLKATFSNSDHRLWPGQFARVSLRLATLSGATVVPSEAVQTGQDGQFVFLVTPGSTVEQRPVTVAQRVGEDVVIGKGVNPGDTIVTEGQLRLEQGTRVQIADSNGNLQDGGKGGQGRGGQRQGTGQGQGQGQGGQRQGGRNRPQGQAGS